MATVHAAAGMRELAVHFSGEDELPLHDRYLSPPIPERVDCGMRVGKRGAQHWSAYWHLVTCHRCRPDLKRLQDLGNADLQLTR